MTKDQTSVLTVGLVALVLCAILPPRKYSERYAGSNGRAPRAFLLFGDMNISEEKRVVEPPGQGYSYSSRLVEIDMARMFAEWAFVVSLTGLVLVRTKN